MASNERTWDVGALGMGRNAISIGIRRDGTGWATFHYGDRDWSPDIPLSVEDVRRLRETLEEIPDELPEQHVPRVDSK